jgi:hypothetical protein
MVDRVVGRATVRRMRDQLSTSARLSSESSYRGFIATLLLLAIASLAGCDRNIEPYQPGEQPSEPDLTKIFPGPAPSGAADQTAGAASRAPDRTALPPSRAEGSAVAGAGGAAPIEGRIELPSELASTRPDSAVLFVIARPQGVKGGPPLAVLRIPDPDFPVEFSIGPANVMIPSMRFEGSISLSARLDADGNAMTRGSDDISSLVEEPLAPGSKGVNLFLTERG